MNQKSLTQPICSIARAFAKELENFVVAVESGATESQVLQRARVLEEMHFTLKTVLDTATSNPTVHT